MSACIMARERGLDRFIGLVRVASRYIRDDRYPGVEVGYLLQMMKE